MDTKKTINYWLEGAKNDLRMASKDAFAVMSQKEVLGILKRFKKHLKGIGIPVAMVYLYGSYGKGAAHYGSDIDICVISKVFQDRIEANLLLRREAIKIDSRIQPISYTPEKFEDWIPLVWEIQSTGLVV